ncbi:MAG: RNA methyltransferase [Oscillospiraceae bacterium]|nr:RNA methyltransferase [Oscillospiraceae bacterium]
MPRIIEVRDLDIPELEVYARLTETQLRSRVDPEKGIFIAETAKVVTLALEAGYQPVSLLMDRRRLEGQGRAILERCGDVPVYTGERDLLSRLTGYTLTRGILCAMRRPQPRSAEEICSGAARIAVLEDVTDSTNVGALFRSAAALGMDAMLLSPSCCDPLCRRAVRVSMGTVLLLPWARLGDRGEDWPGGGIARLHDMGFRVAALALREDAAVLGDPGLEKTEKLALLLGTEGDGLRQETIDLCDAAVRIPMSRGVDSLNVAAAGAVAFWQLGNKEGIQ